MTDAATLGRVRFRAWRRGFREADLILGSYADAHAPAMSAAELERFERLLEQSDHDLYAWIVGSAPIPEAFDDDLMQSLRAFRPPTGRAA
jgi:antitoxin CptB